MQHNSTTMVAKIGEAAPPFPWKEGKVTRCLADLEGEVIGVLFVPQTRTPEFDTRWLTLDGDYPTLLADGAHLVAVYVPAEKKPISIDSFVRAHKLQMPVVTDQGHVIADWYRFTGTPQVAVVDATGMLQSLGPWRDGFEDQLRELVPSQDAPAIPK